MERHLAAILSADAPGDNLLAEFPSVIEALRCAIQIQSRLRAENENTTPHRRMAFRIGISVGDVVMQDKQLYGDGVNIAARVQTLADPGGICLSSSAYEQCENKLDLEFEFLGEQSVKNISKPIPVWRVLLDDAEPSPALPGTGRMDRLAAAPRGVLRMVVPALLVCVIGIVAFVMLRDQESGSSALERSNLSESKERPAIIVLPFENLSDDPDQAYFSNGITEDITTDLSKIDSIFVVPSAAAKRYKGKAIETKLLREEFGIRYLLEGSVRKSSDQVRISARLIDVVDGRHLWSERYDRPMMDIFALQDDIRKKIFTALRVNLTESEQTRFIRASTGNLEAYDFYLRAQDMTHRARRELKPNLMDEAATLYQQAIELDPEYAAAYGSLGLNRWLAWFYGWSEQTNASLESLLKLTEKAIAFDNADPHLMEYRVRGRLFSGDYDGALEASLGYVQQLPRNPEAHRTRAYALIFAGKYEEAVEPMELAIKLYPRYPSWGYWTLGLVYHAVDRNEEAIKALKTATTRAPNYLINQLMLTIIFSNLGYEDEAREQAKQILRISPDYEAETAAKIFAFKDDGVGQSFVNALRKAGIP